MIEAEIYTPAMHDEWNSFVARARNATFLFDRRYMDYHADRFTDHSIVFRRKGHVVALLPLNKDFEANKGWNPRNPSQGEMVRQGPSWI